MKKTRSIHHLALTLALLLFGMQIGLAQGPRDRDPAKRAEHRLERMTEELGLSEAQVAQVRAIQEKYAPEMKALHEAAQAGERDHEKMKALHKAQKKEIKAILTPAQQEKAKEMRGHRRGHHGEMGAGRGHHRMHGHGPRNPEVRTYMKENIMPVILEQRVKLEAQLTAADRAEISALREELKANRPAKKEARQDMRSMRKNGEKPTEAQREAMQAHREQHKAILEKASLIADKYETNIAALHAEIKPQAETWKRDIRAMMEKQAAEGQERPADCAKACEKKQACEGKKGKRAKAEGKHHGHPGKFMRKMDATHFILMDPDGKMLNEHARGLAPEAPALDVFPNPSASHNSIRYEVATAGNVHIQLVTKDGRVVQELLNEYHDAGTYSLDVETGQLKTDVYYYRITDANGPRIKRFTIAQ